MNWLTVLVITGITLGVFLAVAGGMALGVMFGCRPISGSCGGLGSKPGPDGKTSCSLCENPAAACEELQRRQKEDTIT